MVCLLSLCVLVMGESFAQKRKPKPAAEDLVHVQMRNVNYLFTDAVSVGIRALEGTVVPTRPGGVVVFDDPTSFEFNLRYAEIAIAGGILSNVLNQYVFAAPDAPLKDISIECERDMLKIKGKLHQKNDMGFETRGRLAATPDGRIRLEAEKVKAGALPVKGLMDLVGVKIADLINTRKVRGIQSEGNALIFDPEQIFPPPHVKGRVTEVRIQGSEIVQVFGVKPEKPLPPEPANFMAYRGGSLKFGKLTMQDADMVLIDMNPEDAFDFYLDRYKEQLVAGYTKTTPEFGLRVYMKDFNKLGRPGQSAASKPEHR